ncbi:hypothetical protein MMPV_007914 [Pyropia vietnamensis]
MAAVPNPQVEPRRGRRSAVATAAALAAAVATAAGLVATASAVPGLSSVARADTTTVWNYTGQTGPEFWGQLDQAFAGCDEDDRQSPIDVPITESVERRTTLFDLIRPGTASFTARAGFQNVPLECTSDKCGELQWKFVTYNFVNVHAHAPAEHTVAGRTFPLEMHFVHTAGDKIAVLGVLFEISSRPNLLLERLLGAQDAAVDGRNESTGVGVTSTEWSTVEEPDSGYCSWAGSLTTPPCTGGVTWFLSKNVLSVSAEQVRRFNAFRARQTGLTEVGNNRPVQPFNSREVVCYGPDGDLTNLATGSGGAGGSGGAAGGSGGAAGGSGGAAGGAAEDTDSDGEDAVTPTPAPVDTTASDSDDDEAAAEGEATPSPTPDDPVCFPGESTLRRADGSTVAMRDVATGDVVATGNGGQSSAVFMWTHRIAEGTFPFVRLTTSSGAALTASAGHLIYASGSLVPAGTVAVGDTLERVSGSTTIPEAVVSVAAVEATGLYAPAVLDGSDISVDGFRVSTMTTAVKPAAARVLLTPLRWWYRAGGGSLTWFHGDGGWVPEAIRSAVAAISRA